MIPNPVYCYCKKCADYSEYSAQTFRCEAGHVQPKTAIFVRKPEGTEFIFNCTSACEGGAEYSMGRCQSCEELFEKKYDRDAYGVMGPSNFIFLHSQNDIDNVRRKKEELKQQEERPKCKFCGRINEERFVTDPEEIQQNGFFLERDANNPVSEHEYAPYGYCPSTSCLDEEGLNSRWRFGVPLVLGDTKEDHVSQQKTENTDVTRYGKCSECGIGEFVPTDQSKILICDNIDCQLEAEFQAEDDDGKTGNSDALDSLRNDYARALNLRSEVVEPPYYFTASQNYHAKRQGFDNQINLDVNELATKYTHENEWFKCLWTYLKFMRRDTNSTYFQQIIISCYVDKVYSMGHIEPPWLFLERAKIGNEIERAFEVGTRHLEVFRLTIENGVNPLEPHRASMSCVLGLLKETMRPVWPLDRLYQNVEEERANDEGLIDDAMVGLERLQNWKHFQAFKEPLLKTPYQLGGLMATPPGFLETFCLLWSINNKNSNTFNDIKEFIYPSTGNAFWKRMLNELGLRLVNNMEAVFAQMNLE